MVFTYLDYLRVDVQLERGYKSVKAENTLFSHLDNPYRVKSFGNVYIKGELVVMLYVPKPEISICEGLVAAH